MAASTNGPLEIVLMMSLVYVFMFRATKLSWKDSVVDLFHCHL